MKKMLILLNAVDRDAHRCMAVLRCAGIPEIRDMAYCTWSARGAAWGATDHRLNKCCGIIGARPAWILELRRFALENCFVLVWRLAQKAYAYRATAKPDSRPTRSEANWPAGRLASRLASRPHDPHVKTTCAPGSRVYFWARWARIFCHDSNMIMECFWNHFGEWSWDDFGLILERFWQNVCSILGWYWSEFDMI